MSEKKKNIFVRVKDWFVKLLKAFWRLSLDAKIGLIFLISPIIFLINYYIITPDEFDVNVWGWFNGHGKEMGATGALCEALCKGMYALFNGLMAIAGAILIKGNLKKKD